MKTFKSVYQYLRDELENEGIDFSKLTRHDKRYMRRELRKLI